LAFVQMTHISLFCVVEFSMLSVSLRKYCSTGCIRNNSRFVLWLENGGVYSVNLVKKYVSRKSAFAIPKGTRIDTVLVN